MTNETVRIASTMNIDFSKPMVFKTSPHIVCEPIDIPLVGRPSSEIAVMFDDNGKTSIGIYDLSQIMNQWEIKFEVGDVFDVIKKDGGKLNNVIVCWYSGKKRMRSLDCSIDLVLQDFMVRYTDQSKYRYLGNLADIGKNKVKSEPISA